VRGEKEGEGRVCRVIQRKGEERTCAGEDGEALWKTKMGAGTVDAASGDAKGCCGCEGFVAHVWQGVLREMGCGACCYVHHF